MVFWVWFCRWCYGLVVVDSTAVTERRSVSSPDSHLKNNDALCLHTYKVARDCSLFLLTFLECTPMPRLCLRRLVAT